MEEMKDRLVYARKLRGFKTQKSLASKTEKVSRSVIANIETGRFSAHPLVIDALCKTLKINSEWLVTGQGPMDTEETLSPTLEELQEIAERLPEPFQKVLLDTARSMQKHID